MSTRCLVIQSWIVGSLLAIALGTVIQVSNAREAEVEVVYGFGASYCPFKCDPETIGMDGFEVDILREIFQKANLKLVVRRIPETRVLSELSNGSIDVATQIQWTIEQSNSVIFAKEPVSLLVLGALYRAGTNFSFDDVDSLRSVIFVANLGTEWPEEMQAYVDEGSKSGKVMLITDYNYYPRIFKLLRLQRADVTIDDMSVLRFELRRAKIEGQLELKKADMFDPLPSHAIFSKNHPRAQEFANLVATGIRELRTSGRLSEILARYGVEDWQPYLKQQ